jgi:hypothetical protein
MIYVSIKPRLIVMERNQLRLQDVSADFASFLRRISILLSCPHLLVLGNMETASSSIDKSEHKEADTTIGPISTILELALHCGLTAACWAHLPSSLSGQQY